MIGGKPRRRLIPEYHVRPDESVVGAVAAATASHVLGSTRPVLREAGIAVSRPGLVQLAPREQLEALAWVIRADPDALAATAGVGLASPNIKGTHQRVMFGDLTLFRSNLDLTRRRVSPLALARDPYHRAQWLNLLLPYCPVTLERLVDACQTCGEALGWHHAWGIGTCEHCEATIEPSTEPPLREEAVDDYRLFAAMVSPLAADRDVARAVLPKRLRDLDWADVLRLGTRTSFLCAPEAIVGLRQHELWSLPPDAIVAIVTRAVDLLRTWPTGFRDWIDRQAEERLGDYDAYAELRSSLTRIGHRGDPSPITAEMIREVVPEIGVRFDRTFTPFARVYSGKQAAAALHVLPKQLAPVREVGAIRHRQLPDPSRDRIQWDADDVDRVGGLLRASIGINTVATRRGIPVYAVEQLCALGRVERELDRAATLLRSRPLLRTSSVDVLVARLREHARQGDAPDAGVRIRRAMTRFGAPWKPWGEVIEAMADGELPFWWQPTSNRLRHIVLLPEDLAAFDGRVFARHGADSHVEGGMSIDDACEALNLDWEKFVPLAQGSGVEPVGEGRARIVPVAFVETVASASANHAEILAHNRWSRAEMARNLAGLERSYAGWSRAALTAAGVLP